MNGVRGCCELAPDSPADLELAGVRRDRTEQPDGERHEQKHEHAGRSQPIGQNDVQRGAPPAARVEPIFVELGARRRVVRHPRGVNDGDQHQRAERFTNQAGRSTLQEPDASAEQHPRRRAEEQHR